MNEWKNKSRRSKLTLWFLCLCNSNVYYTIYLGKPKGDQKDDKNGDGWLLYEQLARSERADGREISLSDCQLILG